MKLSIYVSFRGKIKRVFYILIYANETTRHPLRPGPI